MTTKLKAANLNATYSADQYLKTSAAGALSWADIAGGGFVRIHIPPAGTYTVPPGVTKLVVEVQGGGGIILVLVHALALAVVMLRNS